MHCAQILMTSFQEEVVHVPLFQETYYLLTFKWIRYHVIT